MQFAVCERTETLREKDEGIEKKTETTDYKHEKGEKKKNCQPTQFLTIHLIL